MQRNAEPGLELNRSRSDRAPGAPLEGVSLNRLLELAPFSDAQAVAIGVAVLRELVRLEANGEGHGALSTRSVRILESGSVQLNGPPAQFGGQPAGSSGDEAGSEGTDVRAAGLVVCAALGVAADHADEVPTTTAAGQIERASRVLVTARAMAQGALGRRAATALGLFQQGVGRLGQPAQVGAALEELGAMSRKLQNARVGGAPPATPRTAPAEALDQPLGRTAAALAATAAVPVVGPSPPGPSTQGALVLAGTSPQATSVPGLPQSWRVALQLVLVAALVFLTIVQLLHLNSPAPSQARSVPTPTPTSVAPSPTAQAVVPAPIVRQPQPVPAFAPATAGRINRVEATLPSTCSAGADCRVNFSVLMSAARTPTPITWSINVFDRCTGITDTVPGGRFVAPNGWVRVELTSLVPLPARLGPQSLVVITSTPDAVAATAIEVGPSGC